MLFNVVLVTAGVYVQMRFLVLRNVHALRLPPDNVTNLKRSLDVWRNADERLVQPYTRNDADVLLLVDQKVQQLDGQLAAAVKSTGAAPVPTEPFDEKLKRLRSIVSIII